MKRSGLLTMDTGRIAIFMVLAFLANLSACFFLPVGVKYIVALVVMGWSVLEFGIHPDFDRAKHYIKYFLLFNFPFLLFWIWSLVIWISQFQTVDFIIRGSLNTIYMATAVGYVVGSYYLFGKKSVYLNFYAMCLANSVVLMRSLVTYGPVQLFSEYITLLVTFSNETGKAIGTLELHDMVFGFGVYVMFFILHREKGKLQLGHLLLACFFFSLALKRIAVMAVAAAVAVIIVYLRLSNNGKRYLAAFIGYCGIAAAAVYLWSIKTEVLFDVADFFNINMMSRDVFYRQYQEFYQLSPTFLGLGVRFIYRYEQTMQETVHQLHNSFLQMYIEVGFWTWFVWLWYEIRFRIYEIGRRIGFQGVAFLLASTIYMWISFATDNTVYYWPPNVAYMHLSICWIEACRRNVNRTEKIPSRLQRRKQGLLSKLSF